jgi:hypothetical protein
VFQSDIVTWGGVIAFTVVSMSFLCLVAWTEHRRESQIVRRPIRADRELLASQAQELAAIARNAVTSARLAADISEQATADVFKAEAQRDAAWEAYDAVSQALIQANAAIGVEPADVAVSDPDQREISRAARAAYRRGELSDDELRAVWHRVDGWDQTRQRRAHELSRLRADVAEAWRGYQVASNEERLARHAAELARIAVRALSQEVIDAALDAQTARMLADEETRRR